MVFQRVQPIEQPYRCRKRRLSLEIAKWPSKKSKRVLKNVWKSSTCKTVPTITRPKFSGGQKQRVGIARALAPQPQVIPPTNPLPPSTLPLRAAFSRCLEDINRRFNVTIVIVTHEIERYPPPGDRAALLDKGRLLEIVEVTATKSIPNPKSGKS